MCTLIILRRPGHPWPLLLAGNRDEMPDRPWAAPGRHWPDRPDLVAGLDRLAEGSWMGVNDHGAVSIIMNRAKTLGPDPEKRSRGELVLEALDHAEAAAAVQALAQLNPAAYRPFNLVVGDPRQAFWIRNDGTAIATEEIQAGLHMLTSLELNDEDDPRIRHYLPLFRAAEQPEPDSADWEEWRALLASHDHPVGEGRAAAMCFRLQTGLSTLSSSLIALPLYPGADNRPIWLFSHGPPDSAEFAPVDLEHREYQHP